MIPSRKVRRHQKSREKLKFAVPVSDSRNDSSDKQGKDLADSFVMEDAPEVGHKRQRNFWKPR